MLYPLIAGNVGAVNAESAPIPREPVRTQAVEALREIEFDRATGKLSDTDYDSLKATYTQQAITAMRSGDGAMCERCGPRPETDARFCSSCGAQLAA